MPINTITEDTFIRGKQVVPLLLAIETGDQKIVDLLLKYGADQNIQLTIDHPTIPSTPREIAAKPECRASLNIINNYQTKTSQLPVSSAATSSSIPSSNASISGPTPVYTPSIASPSIPSSPAQPLVTTSKPSITSTIKSSEPKNPMPTNLQTKLATINNQDLAQLLEQELTEQKDNYQINLPLIWQEIQKRDPEPPYQITFTNQKMIKWLITEDIFEDLTNDFRTELIRGLISRGIPINAGNDYFTPLTLAIMAGLPEKVELLLKLGARTDVASGIQKDLPPRQELEKLKESKHVDKRVSERIEALLDQYDSNKPTTHSLQWNITKGKLIAAVISLGWASAFYRWWTGNKSAKYEQNVIINNTGADIFIRGSQESIAPNATYQLPESGILWIKLNTDQDDAKDLKIDMADYADDLEDSYLNLTIRKKWFSNWFTVPLFALEHWVDRESD